MAQLTREDVLKGILATTNEQWLKYVCEEPNSVCTCDWLVDVVVPDECLLYDANKCTLDKVILDAVESAYKHSDYTYLIRSPNAAFFLDLPDREDDTSDGNDQMRCEWLNYLRTYCEQELAKQRKK